jgi:hypothetical protein
MTEPMSTQPIGYCHVLSSQNGEQSNAKDDPKVIHPTGQNNKAGMHIALLGGVGLRVPARCQMARFQNRIEKASSYHIGFN